MSAQIMQTLGLYSGLFLSGAMISLSGLSVPVLLDTANTPGLLLRQWARLYHYGHIYMPTLAVGSCLMSLAAAGSRARAQRPWRTLATAGIATVAIAPFTWAFMLPTNDRLFALEAQANAAGGGAAVDLGQVRELVVHWNWLHFTRSLLPLLGAVLHTHA